MRIEHIVCILLGKIFKTFSSKCCLAKWRKRQNKHDQICSTLCTRSYRKGRRNFQILFSVQIVSGKNSNKSSISAPHICVLNIFDHMCLIAKILRTHFLFSNHVFRSFYLSHSKCESRIFLFYCPILTF